MSASAEQRRREVLRQASVALEHRVVVLWEAVTVDDVIPLLASAPDPPRHQTRLDFDGTLRRWGVPIIQGTRWVGCRVDPAGRWCVAPVRNQPAAPPPGGVERRSRERITLELAGLCVGVIGDPLALDRQRLPEPYALYELARQPSVIAHEVANPLTAALASAELSRALIKEDASTSSELRPLVLEELASVAAGIERAVDYLRAIQAGTRSAAARSERFDAARVVGSCLTLERPFARKRGVELDEKAETESVFLRGDSNALYQIVANLLRNAVEASARGALPVRIRLERRGDVLRLMVEDRGVGIRPEHIARIFEPGFTTKATGQGSGMGLTLVRSLAEGVFCGHVGVQSTVGEGTVFTVALPIPPQRKA